MERLRKTFVFVGQRFGRLVCADISTMRYPLWTCDCGIQKRISIYSVIKGAAKSCGCYNADSVRARAALKPTAAQSSVGEKFGRLTVMRLSQKKHFVDCRCECGEELSAYVYSIINGDTRSCGCLSQELTSKRTKGQLHHIDLSGKRFGRLFVLRRVGVTQSRGARWFCLCDCGAKKIVSAQPLLKGMTRSCGCLQRETVKRVMTKHGRYKDRDYINELGDKRRAIKSGAFVERVFRKRVYERDMGLCGICGLPVEKGDFTLDHRLPLILGGTHSYENCRTAHASCNFRKGAKRPEECSHLWLRN